MCSLQIAVCSVCSILCAVNNRQCLVYHVQCTVFCVQFSVCSEKFAVGSIQCIVYIVYTVQCLLDILVYNWQKFLRILAIFQPQDQWRAAILSMWQFVFNVKGFLDQHLGLLRISHQEQGNFIYSLSDGFPPNSLKCSNGQALRIALYSGTILPTDIVKGLQDLAPCHNIRP